MKITDLELTINKKYKYQIEKTVREKYGDIGMFYSKYNPDKKEHSIFPIGNPNHLKMMLDIWTPNNK